MKLLAFLLALIPFSASAQTIPLTSPTWFKVANEGDAVTATATVRYGAAQGATATAGFKSCATVGGCWMQLAVSGPITVGNALFGDPIPGTVKELDVMQTTSAQTVTVNGKPVTVPALAPPPPPSVTVVATYNVTGGTVQIVIKSDGSFTLSGTGLKAVKQ